MSGICMISCEFGVIKGRVFPGFVLSSPLWIWLESFMHWSQLELIVRWSQLESVAR